MRGWQRPLAPTALRNDPGKADTNTQIGYGVAWQWESHRCGHIEIRSPPNESIIRRGEFSSVDCSAGVAGAVWRSVKECETAPRQPIVASPTVTPVKPRLRLPGRRRARRPASSNKLYIKGGQLSMQTFPHNRPIRKVPPPHHQYQHSHLGSALFPACLAHGPPLLLGLWLAAKR